MEQLKVGDVVAVKENSDAQRFNLEEREVGVVTRVYPPKALIEFGPHKGQSLGERTLWEIGSFLPSRLPIRKVAEPLCLKIGDRVVALDDDDGDSYLSGEVGTVASIKYFDALAYGVEFDDYIVGHDLMSEVLYQGKDGHCWYLPAHSLQLLDKDWTSEETHFMEEFY